MIRILDEIPLAADRIAPVLEALDRLYLPACEARGLALEQRWVSPPVAVPGQCNILWLLWQVADVPAYYAMRSATGAEARAFWDQVEAACGSRRRHVLGSADQRLETPHVE
ncbi:hypothetical protein [Metapseudomonas furukawaii]|uniref:Uncharacterized protein n=1 Tax=Metapseudomonas furukawaii TaxID=1149133 RepID=A0AAD1BXJ0_METFU|nr:hypothetical protein [Pseudomonas furukawaii]ELS24951.1 hypothetical protein ppKF707_5782 [Pseudomonas furukawaii]BAU72846.1 hypothetical protein KF707C_11580 [Pseudomonas furukawaii]